MFLRGFPHTRQPLGHACPALRRRRVRQVSVLLDQRPSLRILRRRCSVVVRMVHRYCTAVRLLRDVHAGRTAKAFSRRPALVVPSRHPGGLPVLVSEVSRRAGGLRLRRAVRESRAIVSRPCCLPPSQGRRRPDCAFSKLYTPPTYTSVYASLCTSRCPAQNSRPSGSLLLPRKALSSSTSDRFIPAHWLPACMDRSYRK